MHDLAEQLIIAVSLGATYALIALGYTMVYGVLRLINFAHGDIFMIGAFHALIVFLILGYLGITWVPLALLIVLLVAVVLTAAYGWSVERVAYRPLRGAPRLAPLISAIGMSIFLQNFVQLTQGARGKPLHSVIPGGITIAEQAGFSVQVSWMQLIIWVTTIALVLGFTWLIRATALGRAQRPGAGMHVSYVLTELRSLAADVADVRHYK